MDHELWLAWRRAGIGGTDACVIMGVSPWKTPHQLWQEKVYGNTKQLDNSAMSRGRDLEPVARSWFEETMNVTVFPINVTHKESSWLRASLDGLDLEEKTLVEIKCPNKDDHASAVNKKVPEKYWPQVQHQLLVTGLDGMYYCSYDGYKGAIVEVARDNAYIDAMLADERKFWDLVLNKTPPDLTDGDFVPMGGHEQWGCLADQWNYLSQQIKSLEAKEHEIRQSMIELSNDRNAEGDGVRITKSVCPGSIDWKRAVDSYIARLTALHPDMELPEIDLESYRKKPFTKWTFRGN
jgi:putative phage-type endonuclease